MRSIVINIKPRIVSSAVFFFVFCALIQSPGATTTHGPFPKAIGYQPGVSGSTNAGSDSKDQSTAIKRTEALLESVRTRSFPELSHVDIRVRTFQSSSDFFRTRFSIDRYLSFRKMRYYIEVNPRAFEAKAPDDGVRAILAHELEHVLSLSRRSRVGMLSMIGLVSRDFTARFERRADLGAVGLGYAPGLIDYRGWLYKNIPAAAVAEKQRDYFSPQELMAMEMILKSKPAMLQSWMKKVPLNLTDVNNSAVSAGKRR